MNQELLTFYNEYKNKLNAFNLALSTMYFDTATIAPKNGSNYRNKMVSILSGESFTHMVNPESIKKIEALSKEKDLSDTLKKELEILLKDLDSERYVPKDVYVEFTKTIADSEFAWHKAKENKDYQSFKPHLIKVIEMQKKVLSYIPKDCSDYDYLLNNYQKGMNIEKYDSFFNEIKKHLVPLIQKIKAQEKQIDDSVLFQKFNIEDQEKFMDMILSYFKFNKEECYLTLTEHPFTSFFSAHDVRITTHYYENNLISAIMSTIHEYGHALYGLQVDDAYEGTVLSTNIGFAMHESQSRFLENHIGRSRAFWKVHFPKLKTMFSEQLKTIEYEDFMRMINISHPSLIRTEADELTYPLHILIRYELEKEIFNGNVDYDQLDTMWNDKYEEYLGIRPSNDAEGILQDMHWGAANLGYFPTYALGSAYAAQFYHQMEKELDVEALLENHEFEVIQNWQKEHIHKWGTFKDADQILKETCNEPFNVKYYIEYLQDKFSKVYNLENNI